MDRVDRVVFGIRLWATALSFVVLRIWLREGGWICLV